MQLTVTPGDQAAFNCIVQIQGCIGPDSPDLPGFISYMSHCLMGGGAYDQAANLTLKAYIDAICTALIPVATNLKTNVAGLFIMYNYGQAVAGMVGGEVPYRFSLGTAGRFSGPQDWQAALAKAAPGLSLGNVPDSGPLLLMNNGQGPNGFSGAYVARYESAFFNPNRWTTYGDAAKALAPVFATQASDLKTMSNQQPLNDQACLYLLHLLIALCNSPDPDDRDTVNAIVSLTGKADNDPSDPQPNAQLIDRLVYFAMLTWNDPLGSFVWTHDQIKAYVGELAGALRNPDPGSSAIAKVLVRDGKILTAFSSFPGDDPEAPALGFTQRRTVTLKKINDLWTAYTPSS